MHATPPERYAHLLPDEAWAEALQEDRWAVLSLRDRTTGISRRRWFTHAEIPRYRWGDGSAVEVILPGHGAAP